MFKLEIHWIPQFFSFNIATVWGYAHNDVHSGYA